MQLKTELSNAQFQNEQAKTGNQKANEVYDKFQQESSAKSISDNTEISQVNNENNQLKSECISLQAQLQDTKQQFEMTKIECENKLKDDELKLMQIKQYYDEIASKLSGELRAKVDFDIK